MRIAPMSLLVALGAILSAVGNAQDEVQPYGSLDSIPLDTTTQTSWRVLVAGETLLLDSVWNDSIWLWSAPCEGPFVTLRFEANGIYREQIMPCDQPNEVEWNAPLNGDSATLLPNDIVIQFQRSQLDSLPSFSLTGSCFPLIAESAFQSWYNAVKAFTFESDKCRTIESRQQVGCITADQGAQLLRLIPSEDRRLRILKGLVSHIDMVQQLPTTDLFHLQLYREKAENLTR